MKTWRIHAAQVIAKVIQEVGTEDPVALKKAIRKAYPFGERKYWPYKVWLSEVQRQLNPAPAAEPGPDGPLIGLMCGGAE